VTWELDFGPSFEEYDCYYNHKNNKLTVQAHCLLFSTSRAIFMPVSGTTELLVLCTFGFGFTNVQRQW